MQKLPIIYLLTTSSTLCAYAQQSVWDIDTMLTATTGQYVDSVTLRNQGGIGLRIGAEKNKAWGLTTGLLSTRTSMAAINAAPPVLQNNWLLSTHAHFPSEFQPGRWTIQVDRHQLNNTSNTGNSDGVHAIAPKITWLAQSQAFKFDFSYAVSHYRNMHAVHQYSSGMGIALNNSPTWLDFRHHTIRRLTPENALGASQTQASDIRITQPIHREFNKIWPNIFSLGAELGHKIYNINMENKTVYNLPMRNNGGKNITAIWKINNKNELIINAEKTNYSGLPPINHEFSLETLTCQLVTAW